MEAKATKDHAVPKHLVGRRQPKVKGFDYGGSIPVHSGCNNGFGPEAYAAKALELIAVLHNTNCVSTYRHRDDPSVVMMTVNAECLKSFTRHDLRFFKLIDARAQTAIDLAVPSFFAGKRKTNPIRDALFVALAVLTKSAAALLVAVASRLMWKLSDALPVPLARR